MNDTTTLNCSVIYCTIGLFKFRNQRKFGLFLFCNVSKKYISIFIVLFQVSDLIFAPSYILV